MKCYNSLKADNIVNQDGFIQRETLEWFWNIGESAGASMDEIV